MCVGTFKLQLALDCSIEEELGVFNVQEILSGWHTAPVPGARIVAPLDTSKVLGLLPVYSFLNHPVCPKALRRAIDHAGDGVAASDLRVTEETEVRKLIHSKIINLHL